MLDYEQSRKKINIILTNIDFLERRRGEIVRVLEHIDEETAQSPIEVAIDQLGFVMKKSIVSSALAEELTNLNAEVGKQEERIVVMANALMETE